MADLKTVPTKFRVDTFLKGIKDEQRRADCFTIMKIMEKATKCKAKMWGPAIVGFGDYHYVYESGREGDWFITGFSPRKQNLTLYITGGFQRFENQLKNLGKHSLGKGCLYINTLEDVDIKVLREIISGSVKEVKSKK